MIWSLIRVAIFFCLAAAIAFGAGYVLETPGEVRIAFGGDELSLTPLTAIVGVLILFAVFWLLLKLAGLAVAIIKVFTGDETALSRYFQRSDEKRGIEALSNSMIALAAGDGRAAQSQAARAKRLLKRPKLTGLLNAQAAELAGDATQATKIYKELLEDSDTRFVGIHGLLRQNLDAGKTDVALKLAEKAFAIQPKHEGVLNTLFSLQSESGDWTGARKTVEAKVRARVLPRDVGARRDAILSLSSAREAEIDGRADDARKAAYEANRLAPGLVPAAVTAARLKNGEDDLRAATRILKRAWSANPHPDLAAAFAALSPDEDSTARLKRFKPLLSEHPGHPESKLLNAELCLAAEDFPAARRALGDLAETTPTTRTLAIMAAIERGEGADEAVIRGWLSRALTASRGEQWTCNKCRHVHSSWTATCENCSTFDSLSWETPPENTAMSGSPSSMLPVLVGANESDTKSEDTDAPSESDVTPADEPAEPDAKADAEDQAKTSEKPG